MPLPLADRWIATALVASALLAGSSSQAQPAQPRAPIPIVESDQQVPEEHVECEPKTSPGLVAAGVLAGGTAGAFTGLFLLGPALMFTPLAIFSVTGTPHPAVNNDDIIDEWEHFWLFGLPLGLGSLGGGLIGAGAGGALAQALVSTSSECTE